MFFRKRDQAALGRLLWISEINLSHLIRKVDAMALDISKLTADVTAQTSVITSAVTLITGLSASVSDLKTQLDAAIAANDPAAEKFIPLRACVVAPICNVKPPDVIPFQVASKVVVVAGSP